MLEDVRHHSVVEGFGDEAKLQKLLNGRVGVEVMVENFPGHGEVEDAEVVEDLEEACGVSSEEIMAKILE